MNQPVRPNYRLDDRLALLLKLGTWVACACIAVGIVLPLLPIETSLAHANLVPGGILLLIVLPVVRVALMALWFLVHREVRFALVAVLVLSIIVFSAVLAARAG